jgi:hypothetical protein
MRLCTLCVRLALMLFRSSRFAIRSAANRWCQGGTCRPAKMVGHWTMNGTLMGQPTTRTVQAKWVLNHQFLGTHEWGPPDPKTGKPQYEAMPVIGYDNMSERYVAHWIDVFGGRFSETLGYGKHVGNEIDFIFEYPDGQVEGMLANQQNITPMMTGIAIEEFDSVYLEVRFTNPASLHVVRPRTNGLPRVSSRT